MAELSPPMTTADLTFTYVTTIDADSDATSRALRIIDPIAALASRLSALGVDDRATWLASPAAGGARGLRFGLLWRFGPLDQTATIAWRIRLNDDGAGGTELAVTISGRGGSAKAHERLMACWAIVETIALQHAKRLRRAIDEYTATRGTRSSRA
jgi:hypothetical protein